MAERGAWTAPPKESRRYRIRDRWSDYRAGRADGRAGIPRVPSELAAADSLPSAIPPWADLAADGAGAGQDLTAAPADATHSPLAAAYLNVLRSARNYELAGVRHHDEIDRAQLGQELTQAKAHREPLAVAMRLAASRLEEASRPLSNEELTYRGPAERDESEWPAELLAVRRTRARQLLRHQAEEELQATTAALSVAELAVEQAQRALGDSFRAAQALGWQIVHHYGRREASYVRSLARFHQSGPELLELLELAGPDLPGWLLVDSDKEEC